jgi:hypothetical protein
MRNINRRLHALARVFGCPDHGESRLCAECDAEPMPDWLKTGMETFMDAFLARVSQAEIRQAIDRVPEPVTERCAGCGGIRTCVACTEKYAKALFKAIGLTPAEEATLQALTSKVRAIDRGQAG